MASNELISTVSQRNLRLNAPAINEAQGVDPGSFTVATFTTPDTNSQASDFTATVDWGDGDSEQAQVTGSAGSFSVTDDHVYTTPGSFTITVSITDSTSANADASATAAATVADALAGGGSASGLTGDFQEPAIVNQATTLTLATLESIDTTPTDFTATIDWGDGSTPSPITLGAAQNELYQITGAHIYTADGAYTATISVTDSTGTTATTTSTVIVGDLYAGVPATLTLGAFTAPDPTATYTATVAWGDGSTTDATLTESAGVITIVGTHSFGAAGSYTAQVTITPSTGAPLQVNSPTVQVVNAPVTMYTTEIGIAGSDTSGPLAIFTDPNTADTTANFNSNISVGGAAPTPGTITGAGGIFAVAFAPLILGAVPCAPEVQLEENAQPVAEQQPAVAAPVNGGELAGPSVVPGNSIYFFEIPNVPGLAGSTAVSGEVSAGGSICDPNGWFITGLRVQFANTPAVVNIAYVKRVNGVEIRWTKTVTVVEVGDISVGLPFTPVSPNVIAGGILGNGRVGIQSGLIWNAYFDVQAPASNPSAVSAITVGFVQHATPANMSIYRFNANAPAGARNLNLYAYFQGRLLAGQTFLDAAPGNVFYDPAETFTASSGPEQWASLFGRDFPNVISQITRAGGLLFNSTDIDDFQLDVAATIAGDPTSYWAEAGLAWTCNLSIAFDGRDPVTEAPQYRAVPVGLGGLTPAGVWLASDNWVAVNQPRQEVVTALVMNQVGQQVQFRPLGS